ncbi:MAG TPA: YoaK family protein [Alphaproteobacteria bacterium]|nr:YoaK family protein [Alphaproteobacteria bacterium]
MREPGQSANDNPAPVTDTPWRLLVLTACAAGGVDGLSYTGLGHVLTANMTGNTVLLGLALGQVEGLASLRSVTALAGFALGAAAAALMVEAPRPPALLARAIRAALVLETAILILVAALWFAAEGAPAPRTVYALIALSAFAMGVQSAAMRRSGSSGIVTTYITGTMTALCVGVVMRLRHVALPAPRAAAQPVRWHAAVVVTYGLGALAAGALQSHAPLWTAVPPVVALGLALFLGAI